MRLDQSKSTFKTRKDEAESAREPREWRVREGKEGLVLRNSGQGTGAGTEHHKRAAREEVRFSLWPSTPSGTSGAGSALALWFKGKALGGIAGNARSAGGPSRIGGRGGEAVRGYCSVPDK